MTQMHTPWPWYWDDTWLWSGDNPVLDYAGCGLHAAEGTDADRALIAAAPDLLDACEAIVATWDGPKYNHFMADNIDLAKRAIAKAKGTAE